MLTKRFTPNEPAPAMIKSSRWREALPPVHPELRIRSNPLTPGAEALRSTGSDKRKRFPIGCGANELERHRRRHSAGRSAPPFPVFLERSASLGRGSSAEGFLRRPTEALRFIAAGRAGVIVASEALPPTSQKNLIRLSDRSASFHRPSPTKALYFGPGPTNP